MVMDSDYDPGQDSQDSQDETDISDVSDTDIMDKALDTEYMDKVIKQDGAVQVKACRHICGEHDSSSSFDHSSEFEKDETALTPPPKTLQELRGKKMTCSLSPPQNASANVNMERPVAGPSLVQTSTPNGPGAVMAAFGSSSRNNDSLDDTIEGFVDLGDLSNSDVISMGDALMIQDGTSGDDSDTLDADQFNQHVISQDQDEARADMDDDEEVPNLQA